VRLGTPRVDVYGPADEGRRAAGRHRAGPARRTPRSARSSRPRRGRHRISKRGGRPTPPRNAPKRRRWVRFRRMAVRGLVLVAAISGLALAVSILVSHRSDAPRETTRGVATTPVAAEASTALIVGSNEDGAASWMTLLTHDPVEGRGAVVYIPTHTAVEVPGRGLQGLGDALESGGMPLLMLSTENFLGADIDLFVRLRAADAHAFLNELGPLTVDVPNEVRTASASGTARMVVDDGRQKLGPTALTDVLYAIGMDGDDVELGGRHLAFWEGLFEAYRSDPSALRQALVRAGDALATGNASGAEFGSLLEALASLPSQNVRLTILPVRQVSVGGAELYAADADEISRFLRDTLPAKAGRYETDIQILNGNGEPGVGRDAADLLVGRGFRLVRSGNAAEFGHRRTLIVTYDPSAGARKAAQRARRLLGVGQVLVSAQEQGIVDLTVVVGRDFLREH
jgi:hypothetical protein